VDLTLGQFAALMDDGSIGIQDLVDEVVKKLAINIDQELVTNTPVDTGAARSNWVASLDAPVDDVIPPYLPYPSVQPNQGQRFSETDNAEAAMQQAKDVIVQRETGQDIWISNNVSYIDDLNSGSSKQAPALFVDIAIQTGIARIKAL